MGHIAVQPDLCGIHFRKGGQKAGTEACEEAYCQAEGEKDYRHKNNRPAGISGSSGSGQHRAGGKPENQRKQTEAVGLKVADIRKGKPACRYTLIKEK